ncbi:MAG: thioesterase [Clostridiales bacterium]|nr:thioesterase [Clostridiales bacterium]
MFKDKRMENTEEKYLHYKQEVVVAVGDADFNGHIKPSAIMGYCQDIATTHAGILGFGHKDLLARNLVWVMIRMSFKVIKSPKIGETLIIKTFCEKPNKLDVNRGYYINNMAGETVIFASSKWCVLDMNTHKISLLTPLFEKYVDADFIPYQPLDDANPKIQALSALDLTIEDTFRVQVTDLDQNFHMNNARYGDIILNACGVQALKENRISRIDLNFISQLFIGDEYEVYKAQKDNMTFVEAKKSDSDTIIFRARVAWQT